MFYSIIKCKIPHFVKKYPAFYKILKFISVFTTIGQSLSRTIRIQTKPSPTRFLRTISKLNVHLLAGLRSRLSSEFVTKEFINFFPVQVIFLTQLILFVLLNLMLFFDDYNLCSLFLCNNLHLLSTFFHLSSNLFLCNAFSCIFNLL